MKSIRLSWSGIFIACLSFLCIVECFRTPPNRDPPVLKFDIYNIKTPQLIGIIAGCIVFTATVFSVIVLLYKSGTFSRFAKEVASGQELRYISKAEAATPQIADLPELYDHLLDARAKLSTKPSILTLKGKHMILRELKASDMKDVYEASSGQALFHESAYDPERIWGWLPNFNGMKPYSSFEEFQRAMVESPNSRHCVMVDPALDRVVGMISLIHNNTTDLTIQLENIWVTPAYQGKKYSHEAVLMVLELLVASGYRRVTAEVDSRHLIGRKFLERCGFRMEAVLRKHRVVNNRNRDTALYVMLNSEWDHAAIKLKKYLGIDPKPKGVKLADIESATSAVPKNRSTQSNGIVDLNAQQNLSSFLQSKPVGGSDSSKGAKKKKKSKKK